MASLQHHVLARLIPLRRAAPVEDVDRLRRDLVEENRRRHDHPPARALKGRDVSIANDAGFPVFTLEREGTEPRRTLFYLHGGGFVHPSDPRHWLFATRLADAIGARLVFPAYPLAPEATVGTSYDAMLALFAQAAAASPDGVVLAGDSAGGGYALALAEGLRDRARAGDAVAPSHLVLLAPWVDLTEAPGTRAAAARDPWLSYEHLAHYAAFWAGSADPAALRDPRVSPGLGDLSDLPPALMFCGTRDLLQPGCDQLFTAGDEAGWSLEYAVTPEMLHVYPLLPIPEARAAFAHMVEFLQRP
jgi:acetyl esterase/lipase